MPKKKFEIQEGNEIRGFVIRLYPTKSDIVRLEYLQRKCMIVWNWLVSDTETVLKATEAYALKKGMVVKPNYPDYDAMATNEERAAAKKSYIEECKEYYKQLHEATKDLKASQYRKISELQEHFGTKYDYHLYEKVIGWRESPYDVHPIRPGAHLFQAITKNYFTKAVGMRRKKFRDDPSEMPLQVRSGDCFKVGEFGCRGQNHRSMEKKNFYDCMIMFNGLKIRGRLPGKFPEGRVLEGVTIKKLADGWYASIKVEVPIRTLPEAEAGVIVGMDVGLDSIAVISDGDSLKPISKIENPRDYKFSRKIAKLQKQEKPVGRLLLAEARRIKDTIYKTLIHGTYKDKNGVERKFSQVEMFKIEKLSRNLGIQGDTTKVSAMSLIQNIVRQRFGTRVREVEAYNTSRMCSQCGIIDEESWSYWNGKIGKCTSCGFTCDRDLNAARNIARKDPIPLES